MTQKALFFDIDGTIYFHGHIPLATRLALKKAKANGHKLFINSGRGRAFVPKKILECADWDGMICGCSYVEINKKAVCDKRLSADQLRLLIKLGLQFNWTIDFEGVTHTFSYGYSRPDMPRIPSADYITQNAEKLTITKASLRPPLDEEKINLIKDEFAIVQMPGYTETFCKGFDKGTGIDIVCKELGISKDDTIGFGDSMNDKAMIFNSCQSVVMKTAPNFIKAKATYVPFFRRLGIYEGMKKLKLI